jgi:hypothetical protein
VSDFNSKIVPQSAQKDKYIKEISKFQQQSIEGPNGVATGFSSFYHPRTNPVNQSLTSNETIPSCQQDKR